MTGICWRLLAVFFLILVAPTFLRGQDADADRVPVAQGSGSLSAPSAVTNSQGYASVTLTLTNFSNSVQLNACVAPGNNPCQNIYGNAVAAAPLNLQAVAGAGQVVTGTAFQPLMVRVTDSSTPPNPILGASVLFQSALLRAGGNDLTTMPGNLIVPQTGMPVILSSSQNTIARDANGLASFVPSVGSFTGPLEIEIQVSAGTTAVPRTNWRAFRPAAAGTLLPPLARGTEVFPLRGDSCFSGNIDCGSQLHVIPSLHEAKARNLLFCLHRQTAGSSLRSE